MAVGQISSVVCIIVTARVSTVKQTHKNHKPGTRFAAHRG